MAEMSQAEMASTQATAGRQPVYEVGFHLMPSISEEELGAAVGKVRALLGNAEIISEGFPQKTALAYTIDLPAGRQGAKGAGSREKFSQAYFGWFKFSTEREALPAIESALRSERQIIRFIVIETIREDIIKAGRAVFSSDRLEGETIKKVTEAEKGGEVSQEELDKSIDALTG